MQSFIRNLNDLMFLGLATDYFKFDNLELLKPEFASISGLACEVSLLQPGDGYESGLANAGPVDDG